MIQLISKYRQELMGLATLWVVLFHNHSYHPGTLTYLSNTGYGGVDIFLFLSGFGLTVGYGKHSILGFYLRRFIRVTPVLFLLALVWAFLEQHTFTDAVISSLGIGYYFPRRFIYWDWYVPTIYLLYLFFPLWMRINRKADARADFRTLLLTTLAISLMGILWSVYNILQHRAGMNMLATTRIPIFFIGSWFGYLYNHKKELRPSHNYLLIAVATVITLVHPYAVEHLTHEILWRKGAYWFPLMFSIPGLILLLAKLLSKAPSLLLIALRFLGGISLEFYLIHCNYLYCNYKYFPEFSNQYPYLSLLVLIGVCCILSKAFQWVLLFFIHKIKLPK